MDRWPLAGGCAPGSLVGGAGWAPGCGGGPWLETLVGALLGALLGALVGGVGGVLGARFTGENLGGNLVKRCFGGPDFKVKKL